MADDHKHFAMPGVPEALKQVAGPGAGKGSDEAYQTMRQVGGHAWQLLAALRAADHFIALDDAADRITGSWLVACAVDLAEDVTTDLDALARVLKDRPVDGGAQLHKLRARAHKLHAAARAADHFLDQDTGEDRSTASWLVACALTLATRLAGELDDEASQFKRPGGDAPAGFSDVVAGRKGVTATLRGAIA